MINIHCTGASQPETEVKCLQLKVSVEDFLGHQDREPFGPHAITGAATLPPRSRPGSKVATASSQICTHSFASLAALSNKGSLLGIKSIQKERMFTLLPCEFANPDSFK